jgi:drug/metabolite transporter (DMT)-like permease
MKITPNRIKTLCAVVLLCCLALPFSSCSRDYDEDGKLAQVTQKPAVKTVTEYKYPFQIINFLSVTGWLFLYSFLWPLPILAYRRFRKNKLVLKIIWICEPVFVMGAIFFLITGAMLETPAIGENLAVASNGLYGITWVYELIIKIINNIKNKKSRKKILQ